MFSISNLYLLFALPYLSQPETSKNEILPSVERQEVPEKLN